MTPNMLMMESGSQKAKEKKGTERKCHTLDAEIELQHDNKAMA